MKMILSKKTYVLMAAMLMLTVTLSGCVDLAPPPETGFTLKLTDPTVTDLESVWVIITKIEVYPKGDVGEGSPVVVFEGEMDVDLLDLQYPEMVTVVRNIELPPGDYGHFKLYLQELDGLYHGVDVTESRYHALAIPDEGAPFLCVVPPGKFNVQIWDPVEGKNTYFTKVDGVAITVIIDFRWNGNMASNPNNNLNPTGKAYVETVILPDISITKMGSVETIEVGETVNYTIAVTVDSDAVATLTNVTDTIPEGMSFVVSNVTCSVDGATIKWELGDVYDSTVTIEVEMQGDTAGDKTNMVSVVCKEGMYDEASVETTVTSPPSP
jgi:uncharacterized repeat protein (TIGR01451 family)